MYDLIGRLVVKAGVFYLRQRYSRQATIGAGPRYNGERSLVAASPQLVTETRA